MRITSRMLNEAKAKAGIETQTKSLLSYINNDNKKSALMTSLGQTQRNKVTGLQKSNYENLENASANLYDSTNIFTSSEEDIYSEEALDELYTNVEDFVNSYNETVKSFKYTTGTLDTYYAKMLKEAATDSEEELKTIGITVNSDGTLTLDKNKLKDVDAGTIKDILGKNSEFLAKVALISEHTAKNAAANVDSLSNKYNAAGTTYSSVAGRYNVLR